MLYSASRSLHSTGTSHRVSRNSDWLPGGCAMQ
ncbi:protein phosphatase 1, regulatory (inhibitor) subunit 16A (predicted), isoform CRA_b [Rattus norvegicus]|uniref:Protein phosphatase 1, regulatory (Inhibitor) subunit 16A (Predicted), isoform CRA_b n=1 Tax=Rattus norvegicus TaxID=10116 RepID=A6HSC3_RAT|nr:protein phosphatase 1, regulatory (inhibitor) subunit 16A (predicted), isoform CRA_b [Rattus norvegicus]